MPEPKKPRPAGIERAYLNLPTRTAEYYRHYGQHHAQAACVYQQQILIEVAEQQIDIKMLFSRKP